MADDVIDQERNEQAQQESKDAQAGFAAGFARVSGQEPDPAQTEAQATEQSDAEREAAEKAKADAEAKAQAEAEEKAKADAKAQAQAEYDALPAALREKLQSVDATVNKLAGHIGGLSKATTRIEAALKAASDATAKAGGEAPSDKQVQAAISNPEAWKQLKEDFPDWAGPIEAEFTALRGEIKRGGVDLDTVRQEAEKIASTRVQSTVSEFNKRFLTYLHPDWEQIDQDPNFTAWAEKNPDRRDKIVKSGGDPFIVADVLKEYKAHRATEQDAEAKRLKQQRRLEAAVTPATTGASRASSAGISDAQAFNRGFNKVHGERT